MHLTGCWIAVVRRLIVLQCHILTKRSDPYTRADDMAALAYLLLAVRLMGHPPWSDEILNQDLSEDREAVIATRARVIAELRAQKTVEDHLLDFVSYATSLEPDGFIDYVRWTRHFDEAIRWEPVSDQDQILIRPKFQLL